MSLVVKGLCKRFGEKTVLDGLDLTMQGPLVLMGPSGCGKTTLLRILMGLEQADAGTVAGTSAGGRVAAVFQEDRLCPQLDAVENLCLAGNGLARQQAKRELMALGFAEAELALPAAKLSGGQRRRAALLRALLCRNADLLLLDEPFTGMDEALVADAAAATVRLAGQRDAILVTHDHAAARLLGWPIVEICAQKNR